MLIRLKLARHPHSEETPAVFPGLLPPARPRILPLAYSAGIHAAVLLLLPVVSQYGMTNNSGRTDLARYKVEMIPLRVPLYFSQAEAPAPQPRKISAVAKKSGVAAAPQRNNASSEAAAPPRAVKPFELPVPAVRVRNAPLILQPEAVPAAQPAKAMPSMAFWARMQSAPRRPVRGFVTPARTEQPAPAPRLDAPPVLAVPNRQPTPGDVNVALSSTPARPTRLFVQNSSTVPVRLPRDEGASEASALDAVAGEAANVIVLGGPRPAAALMIEVPKGLSQGPGGEAARAGSGAAGGTSGAGSGKQAGTSTAAANSGASGKSGAGESGAKAASGNASSQSRNSGAAGRSSGSGSNATGAVLPPPAVGPPAAPPPIRITHPPVGSFDVVVAQSGAAADLPEAAGILTGNPIYTVYLRVGDEREWLLEYCLPGEKQVQSNPYEINIGPVIQVTPPYPLFTSIPGSLLQRRRRDHIVLHGYLTANGAFRDVKAANSSDALGREILALLGDWRFRPALRDRTPIGVEVLLVVPPRAEN